MRLFAAQPKVYYRIGSDSFEVYRVADGSDAIEILERPGSVVPALARYYQHGNLVIALRYVLYETGLSNEPALFTRPPRKKRQGLRFGRHARALAARQRGDEIRMPVRAVI